MQQTSAIHSRQHFQILDGLRGIAAVAVVIFHFMEIAVPNPNNNFIVHAYLAVDFFFCLSGFVIAYAYDERLHKVGISTFLKLRLIRLHPLVIIGSVVGIIVFVFDPMSNLHEKYTDKLLLMFLASCLMIPYAMVRERYFNLFHLNAPAWSLFWEYVANIVYALVLIRLPKTALWVLLVIAAGLLVYEAHISTNLSVGWGGDNVMGGGIRVFYSFLAGILIYRCKWIITSNLGFLTIGAMLLASLLIPFSDKTNPVVEPLVVIFYFPLIIALGAGAKLTPALKGICHFSGEISYPLYMVHYPFIWLFMSYIETQKPNTGNIALVIITGTPLLIGFAYVVLKFVDEPVRRWLKGLMINKQN